MKRRKFLLGLSLLGVSAAGGAAYKYWPEQGFTNPCLSGLPDSLANHELLQQVWQGIDPHQVWDSHVHLVGIGDSTDIKPGSSTQRSGPWFNPVMESYWHPILKAQKHFYMNAGCVGNDQLDQSYVARMLELVTEMRPGFKLMLYAFDWYHDENGNPDQARSMFYIPNAYATQVAKAHPDAFEWVASIHPYRADCVEALRAAIEDGARAIKWLPSAMGIDPLSPKCDRFYEAVAAAGIPIISHAGRELAVLGGNQDDGNPLRLRRALDHGVKVVLAHCASYGQDQDIDQGSNGPRLKSFELFARMMDESRYADKLYADISALTQLNRAWALKAVLQHRDWHPRLLNGSDYPLPGVMPLFSATDMADMGMLDRAAVPVLQAVRSYNPLLFDFALKRLLRFEQYSFPISVFETRRFFENRIL